MSVHPGVWATGFAAVVVILYLLFGTGRADGCGCPDTLCSATSESCGPCRCVIEPGERIGHCG